MATVLSTRPRSIIEDPMSRIAVMALANALRTKWRDGDTALGIWCSIADSFATEVSASRDFDYACVDLQHGPVGFSSLVAMIQAIELHGSTPIVRVSAGESWMIMQALDAGAAGVIVPMIDDADEAARAVAACRYPPTGARSFGPTRASVAHGTHDPDELATAACILMIETERGLANLESIAATPGVDALYIGPADLALALGVPPKRAAGSAEHAAAIESIRDACRRHGLATGIHCPDGAAARARSEQNFHMVTVGSDAALLHAAVGVELAIARGGNAIGR